MGNRRLDILRLVNNLARSITKWTKATDGLVWSLTFIHHGKRGNIAEWVCVKTQTLLLRTQNHPQEVSCVRNFCLAQLHRVWDHSSGCWISHGWVTCSRSLGHGDWTFVPKPRPNMSRENRRLTNGAKWITFPPHIGYDWVGWRGLAAGPPKISLFFPSPTPFSFSFSLWGLIVEFFGGVFEGQVLQVKPRQTRTLVRNLRCPNQIGPKSARNKSVFWDRAQLGRAWFGRAPHSSPRESQLHLWRQRSRDQNGDETCVQNPKSFDWLFDRINLEPKIQIKPCWHQKPTRRHSDQSKFLERWADLHFAFRKEQRRQKLSW